MSIFKNQNIPLTGAALDSLLDQLLSPQIGSGLLNDCNYTGPGNIGTTALAIDVLRAVPVYIAKNGRINRLGFVITTAGGAGALARIGIYASDPNNSYYPTSLLVDGGSFDGTGTGVKNTVVDVPVQAGQVIWLVYSAGVAAPTINSLTAKTDGGHLLGFASANPILANSSLTVALAHAALPAAFPAGAALSTTAGPAGLIRFA